MLWSYFARSSRSGASLPPPLPGAPLSPPRASNVLGRFGELNRHDTLSVRTLVGGHCAPGQGCRRMAVEMDARLIWTPRCVLT